MTAATYNLKGFSATNSVSADEREYLSVVVDNSLIYEEDDSSIFSREEWTSLFESKHTSGSTVLIADIIRKTQQLIAARDNFSVLSKSIYIAIVMASEAMTRLQEASNQFDDAAFSEEIDHFLTANNLQNPLQRMLDLISVHFAESEITNISVKSDVEVDEQWVDVSVKVKNPPRETAEIDTALLLEWVKDVPMEQTDLIRISYKFK